MTSGFGGLEVACWPLVPKFKPGRSRRIFQGEKILNTPSFGREVKPFVSCRRFTACKRSLNVTWKSGIFRQNSSAISRPSSPSFHYQGLWWRHLAVQVGTTKDQGFYNKPSAAVHPGPLAAGTLPQYDTSVTVTVTIGSSYWFFYGRALSVAERECVGVGFRSELHLLHINKHSLFPGRDSKGTPVEYKSREYYL